MADENDSEKKSVSESLRDWGIDVGKFEERAKESLGNARDDLSEIAGTLRHTLVQAKDVIVGLQKNGAPVAAEIKTGFERAWQARTDMGSERHLSYAVQWFGFAIAAIALFVVLGFRRGQLLDQQSK